MKKNSELTLYYQDVRYSWQGLCQQISALSHTPALQKKNTDSIFCLAPVLAKDRFLTTLYLLYGFSEKRTVIPLSNDYSDSERSTMFKQVNACCLKNISLAIATSGSQAKPKIALINQNNIVSHCQSFSTVIPLDNQTVWLNCMPMNHIAGVIIIYRCWFNNATMVLHDEFDAKKIWDDIHRYKVSHISLVPKMLSRLLDYQMEYAQDVLPPKHLKYVIVGGDRLSGSLYRRADSAGWSIYISYGMTETTSTVAIGRTADTLKLLDGFDAHISSQGTLTIKGSMVISAYAGSNRDEIQNACFEKGCFKSNDLVELDERYIKITGRNDHMIISGGKNIAPEYIETLLSSVPGIDDIAIGKYRYPDCKEEWGDTIVALVCGNSKQLKHWLQEHVKPCYQPRIFIEVEKIPRNSLGKINRKKIQLLVDATKNL